MEKAFLVGVNLNDGEDYLLSLEELDALAQACDMEVVGIAEQTLPEVHKAYYIGTGKVDEVKEMAMDCGADVIIFDNSLSPMQLRNLQERLEKPVLDRSTLILDIFAGRARSREAKLQVEVARLQYMLPRLVGLHAALGRQGGGTGSLSNKGAGEKKTGTGQTGAGTAPDTVAPGIKGGGRRAADTAQAPRRFRYAPGGAGRLYERGEVYAVKCHAGLVRQ